jgi:hypothetical protein
MFLTRHENFTYHKEFELRNILLIAGGLGEGARKIYQEVLQFQQVVRLQGTPEKPKFITGQEEVRIHLR